MKTNWQTKKLGEVCDIFNGNSINAKIKKEKYLGLMGGYSFIATKDVGFDSRINYENGVKIPKDEIKFKISKKNSVLVCAEGGSAGRKIGFTKEDVCFGNKLFSIYSDKHNNKFIYYFCFTDYFQEEFKKDLTGIIGGVSLKKFKQIQIFIPSLPTQTRIVKILDKAFAEIETAKKNAERNLANAENLFESYLQEMFANGGDDWETKKLNEVCEEIFAGGDKPKNNFSKFKTDAFQIPIFSNGVKNNGLYGYTNIARVKKPSITISARGTIGYSMIRKELFLPIIRLIVLLPKDDLIDLYFLHYSIKNNKIAGNGTSIPQLTVPAVKKIKISFPKFLKTQKQIVSKLDTLSASTKKLEKNYQRKIDDLEELKKAVLKKAFEGKL